MALGKHFPSKLVILLKNSILNSIHDFALQKACAHMGPSIPNTRIEFKILRKYKIPILWAGFMGYTVRPPTSARVLIESQLKQLF